MCTPVFHAVSMHAVRAGNIIIGTPEGLMHAIDPVILETISMHGMHA